MTYDVYSDIFAILWIMGIMLSVIGYRFDMHTFEQVQVYVGL